MQKPDPEELREWQANAEQRRAILPSQFGIRGHYVQLICGHCKGDFTRKMLPQRNDPVYVCPKCNSRNYVPIQW